VDTFIVFRSLTPLLVAIADTAFRKQPCPLKDHIFISFYNLGWGCGVCFDRYWFYPHSLFLGCVYLITITTEMVYIKHIVMNLGLNTWGFVFYNNLLSLMMAPFFWFIAGESTEFFSKMQLRLDDWF
jgi:hypothetical protein